MNKENLLILNAAQIEQKITRLAYQVFETHFNENEIVICGIAERGFLLAKKVAEKLREISHFSIEEASITVDKNNPLSGQVRVEPKPENLQNKIVIVCDDVLYTGRTMAYAALPFLQEGVKKLQCLVLVHRNHLHFPIQPSFIGLSLATTLQESVNVDFNNKTVHLL